MKITIKVGCIIGAALLATGCSSIDVPNVHLFDNKPPVHFLSPAQMNALAGISESCEVEPPSIVEDTTNTQSSPIQ